MVLYLFYDALSTAFYVASVVEGSGHSLFQGTIPVFSCIDWQI
jgi:hypothetical protein